MSAPQNVPPVGARVTITGGTRAGEHGEVVGHHTSHGHQSVLVRLDGATKSTPYQPTFVKPSGTVQGDLFAGGDA